MSEYVHPCRLSFMLPGTLVMRAPIGRHAPCLAGCLLTVDRGGLVTVGGPSRERVFDQATRFFRVITKGMGLPPLTIAARLRYAAGRIDTWQIVLGADIAFAPCGIEPHLPSQDGRERPFARQDGRERPDVAGDAA